MLSQLAWCVRRLRHCGVTVVDVILERVSGWHEDRFMLEEAIFRARKRDAIVIAESSDRFIRPRDYHTEKRPEAMATVWEHEELKKMAAGNTIGNYT